MCVNNLTGNDSRFVNFVRSDSLVATRADRGFDHVLEYLIGALPGI